jgi:hypothetical protein
MAILKKIRETFNKTFGKGVKYPVSKLNQQLESIVRNRTCTEPENDEYLLVADTFMQELARQFEGQAKGQDHYKKLK